MALGRGVIAAVFMAVITVASFIQKVWPNDITIWFREPIIMMILYSIAMIIIFYPWMKGKYQLVIVASLAVSLAGLITYGFHLLYG